MDDCDSWEGEEIQMEMKDGTPVEVCCIHYLLTHLAVTNAYEYHTISGEAWSRSRQIKRVERR